MDFLHRHIEALIFCAPEPLGVEEIVACLSEMFGAAVPSKDVEAALSVLSQKYESEEFAFALEKLGGGYQFLTKPAYQPSIQILLRQHSQKRLSTAQLETLSIIAYKQPVTKGEVEQIRGVSCYYSLQKLLEKEYLIVKMMQIKKIGLMGIYLSFIKLNILQKKKIKKRYLICSTEHQLPPLVLAWDYIFVRK